jgi:hypothetical protein
MSNLLKDKLNFQNFIKGELMKLNHKTGGAIFGGNVIDQFASLDPSKIASYGEKGVKYLTGVNLPFEKAVNAVLSQFGQPSALQKSIMKSQKIDKYGKNFKDVVEKYGLDSDKAKEYAQAFPERIYEYYYIYNTPNDVSSGLKYPQNYQDLYIYEQQVSDSGSHGKNFYNKVIPFAQNLGIDFNDPQTQKILDQISHDKYVLGTTGHY